MAMDQQPIGSSPDRRHRSGEYRVNSELLETLSYLMRQSVSEAVTTALDESRKRSEESTDFKVRAEYRQISVKLDDLEVSISRLKEDAAANGASIRRLSEQFQENCTDIGDVKRCVDDISGRLAAGDTRFAVLDTRVNMVEKTQDKIDDSSRAYKEPRALKKKDPETEKTDKDSRISVRALVTIIGAIGGLLGGVTMAIIEVVKYMSPSGAGH